MVRNKSSVFANIGASSHSTYEREKNDYYSTDEEAIRLLHKHNLLDKDVQYWETACGGGRLSKELIRLGYDVVSSDLFDRGYGDVGVDFFECNEVFQGNTITNPPYSFINDWIVHSLKITSNKIYIFCRIQTIETISRYERIFKDNPPVLICPFVKRIKCYLNNDSFANKSSAVCYAWFIWDNKDNSGVTKVKWLI